MIHAEPPGLRVEQFLAILRFEQRDRLEELPGHLLEGERDDFYYFTLEFP